jgi:hypothetical protein
MLRLQGFPDTFKIVVPDSQIRKQAGNAVPVNIIEAVLNNMIISMIGNGLINTNEIGNVNKLESAFTECG